MVIRDEVDGVDWQAVTALFEAVGWGARDPALVRSAFDRSTHVAFVFDDDALVAMGRTIDDGAYYATIVDVVVAPTHQRRGLGARVVRHLVSKLSGYLSVTLTSAPGVQPFYEKLGFKRQLTAMMLPRSPEQEAAHC